MAYNITFSPDAWADYLYWQSEDKKTLKRINRKSDSVPVSFGKFGFAHRFQLE